MNTASGDWIEANQQRIAQLDPWLDWILPISTALLLIDRQVWAYGLIYAWLLVRLLLQSRSQSPLIWLLIGLALVNAGTIILDRGGEPSDPSDLLLIVLAFSAGLDRPEASWQRSFAQIGACFAPITVMAISKPAEQLLKFPAINVNRMSFLIGLLVLLAWGLSRMARNLRERWAWGAVAGLGIPLALATGSRAALVAPVLALVLAWLIRKLWGLGVTGRAVAASALKAGLAGLLLLAIGLGSIHLWYGLSRDARTNQLSDAMRFPTALCWANAPFRKEQPLLGLGFNERVRRHCDGDNLDVMRAGDRPEGLPHAHNVIAQTLAETGIAGLVALAGFSAWVIRKLAQALQQGEGLSLIREAMLPVVLYYALTGMTTSFHIFLPLNQVLIGYGLAALTGKQGTASKSEPQRSGS